MARPDRPKATPRNPRPRRTSNRPPPGEPRRGGGSGGQGRHYVSKSQVSTGEPGRRGDSVGTGVLVRRHIRFGWWVLCISLSFGIVLETLHGFKVGLYLDVSNSTRRLMWTLAHAHGTLLALVNIVFAFTIERFSNWPAKARNLASTSLVGATILMPAGFFLGGVFIYGGDPGLSIFLLPIGAFMLLVAIFTTLRSVGKRG